MKIRFILFFVAIGMIMAFAPTNFPIDLRVVPVSPSISDSVWLLGHKKTTGVYTTYRFSMPQLASYLGAGTGLGNNFANADLTLTANRFHHFNKQGMVWDHVKYFNYADSNGDSIIAVNSIAPNNYMVWISSYGGDGSVIFGTKSHRSKVSIGTNSSSFITGGTSHVEQSSSGGCKHIFSLGGVSPFVMDSSTNSITIGICPNCITYNWVTGVTNINAEYTLPLVDATSTDQFMTSNGAGIASWATITKLGLVTKYNGSTVVGNGIPAIRASSFSAGATTAQTIASITASANVYEVGGFININSISVDELALRLTFTDVSNVVHTQDLTPNGAPNNRLTAAVHYIFPKVEIMPKFGSTISLSTVLTTGGGSINYDFSGHIVQMN